MEIPGNGKDATRFIELAAKANKDPFLFATNFLFTPNRKKDATDDGVVFEKFEPSYIQELALKSDKKTTYLCVSRRSGKCVPGFTKVLHPVTLKPTCIEEMEGVDETWCFDFSSNSLVKTKCEWIDSGEKECLSFTFQSGSKLGLSTDHLVFHYKSGWVRADSIRPGDKILAPATQPVFGEISLADVSKFVEDLRDNSIINDLVYKFNKATLCAYFREVFDSLGRYLNAPSNFITLILGDKNLALELKHLLTRIGVSSCIDSSNNILILSELDCKLFLNSIGFPVLITEVPSTRKWETITGIVNIGYRKVYDLCVHHDDHNFIANDVVIHNSYVLQSLVLFCLVTQPGSKNILYVPDGKQATEFFAVLKEWLSANPHLNAQITVNTKTPYRTLELKVGDNAASRFTIYLLKDIEGNRGATADNVFVDEAQALQEKHWKVIEPIMIGDGTRLGKVRSFIAGTIIVPEGKFYHKTYKKQSNDREKVIYVPITKNPAYTPEQIEEIKAEVGSYATWKSEYLLEPTTIGNKVFRDIDIEHACRDNYETGIVALTGDRPLFLTVDWDKVQCGTNILVQEWDPVDDSLKIVYHQEVPHDEFHYHLACQQVLEVFAAFSPALVLVDSGAGEMQWEHLLLAGSKMFSNFAERLIQLKLGSSIEKYNPLIFAKEKIPLKPYMINLLVNRFQDKKFYYPKSFEKFTAQLYKYEVVRVSKSGQMIYSNKDEHIIDCAAFGCYGVDLYKNMLDNGSVQLPNPNPVGETALQKILTVRDPSFENFTQISSPMQSEDRGSMEFYFRDMHNWMTDAPTHNPFDDF